MNVAALQSFMAQEFAHAAVRHRLDEELGMHHGLSWQEFVLLDRLEAEGGVPEAQLAGALGVPRSQLLLRIRPLEKLGWIVRHTPDGAVRTQLSAAGRRLLGEARETAASACAQLRLASRAAHPPPA